MDDKRVAEPVAYLYRWKLDGEWVNWRVSDHSQKSTYLDSLEEKPLCLLDALTTAQARIAELQALVEWRLIGDDVPSNTPILCAAVGWACEGYMLGEVSERDGTFWQANDHWTDAHDAQIHPTHWRPMPTPPESKP